MSFASPLSPIPQTPNPINQFPHGTIPLGAVLAAHYIDEVVPGKKILCLIHTGIMHLPIVRFFMGALVGGALCLFVWGQWVPFAPSDRRPSSTPTQPPNTPPTAEQDTGAR